MRSSRNDTVLYTKKQFFDLAGPGVRLKHVERYGTTQSILFAVEPLDRVFPAFKHIFCKRENPCKAIEPVALYG